ncbi:MAG: uncharacterized DUF497 family protein [Rickettsiales bacterium]|jgi:uncharacterized DUF497 family protein
MGSSIFNWNEEKNRILKENRNICFEEIIIAIQKGDLLEIIPNPSKNYTKQKCFVVGVNDYAYIVPYVEDENGIFLKTIYPSRKYKKLFLNK